MSIKTCYLAFDSLGGAFHTICLGLLSMWLGWEHIVERGEIHPSEMLLSYLFTDYVSIYVVIYLSLVHCTKS